MTSMAGAGVRGHEAPLNASPCVNTLDGAEFFVCRCNVRVLPSSRERISQKRQGLTVSQKRYSEIRLKLPTTTNAEF